MISALIIFLVIKGFDIDVFNSFSQVANYKYIAFALLFPILINPIISNNRWKLFLKLQDIKESFFTLVRLNFIAVFLGLVLPSSIGFDAVRVALIEKKHKSKQGMGGASIIIERMFGFYLLSLLGVIGACVAYYHGAIVNLLLIALLFHFTIIILFVLLKNRYVFSKLFDFLNSFKKGKKIALFILKIYEAVYNFPISKNIGSTFALILTFQLSTVVCAALIFKAFDIQIPLYYHLAFLPLIFIVTIIPVTISGFGIREGGFVYLYGIVGVPANISIMVSLLYYSLQMLVPAFIGMLLYLLKKDKGSQEIAR